MTDSEKIKQLEAEVNRLKSVVEEQNTLNVQKLENVFILLLKEVQPKTVLWKSMSGTFTAQDIINDLEVSGDIGRQYIEDFLRLTRDILQACTKN